MLQRRLERTKQERIDHARRRQIQEEEREAQQRQAAQPHADPLPQISPSTNPPPTTTNHEQQTSQIKPTESTATDYQPPFAASEPTISPPSPQNVFDETKPPPQMQIENRGSTQLTEINSQIPTPPGCSPTPSPLYSPACLRADVPLGKSDFGPG